MALSFANEHGIRAVVAGINDGDAQSEAEHGSEFFTLIDQGSRILGATTKLVLPFQGWPKAAIIREGALLGAPLAASWSCVTPLGRLHDGQCHACVERIHAFRLAGVPDPTEYQVVATQMRGQRTQASPAGDACRRQGP
jgi:7-cyano-7-deazaguanine synthase